MAAAAIAINALPNHLQAVFIDSLATIYSLTEKAVTERQRLKASGRAWKNFTRRALCEKNMQIRIFHIKAHQGIDNLLQQGNDMADQVAKSFMSQGEKSNSVPYFTASEEQVMLFYNETLLDGDIRRWMTNYEKTQALAAWKGLKMQGRLIEQFPKQIPALAKEIWKSSLQRMDGNAWIYFVFAICNHLPTNSQKFKFLNPEKMSCNLCQTNQIEDVHHVFTCPALSSRHNNLRNAMDDTLKKWNLPYCNVGQLPEMNIKELWFRTLKPTFTEHYVYHPSLRLTESYLWQLIDDYWQGNKGNRHKSLQDLRQKLQLAIKRYNCHCIGRHSCQLQECWTLPQISFNYYKGAFISKWKAWLMLSIIHLVSRHGFLVMLVTKPLVHCMTFFLIHYPEKMLTSIHLSITRI